MAAVLRTSLLLSVLALFALAGCEGPSVVQITSPLSGEVVTASAVQVDVSLEPGIDPAFLRAWLNGVELTPRLRVANGAAHLLLAGLPDEENPLRLGANRLEVRVDAPGVGSERVAAGQKIHFRWDPRLEQIHIIAVGHRIELDTLVSFASWEAEVDRIFEELVVPNLSPDRPNLVVLSEDFGLPPSLIGSRGAEARALVAAEPLAGLSTLFAAYGDPWTCYMALEPRCSFIEQSADKGGLARGLFLAATDTLVRSFEPILRERAAHYGIHLVASADLPDSFRSTDPEQVAFFGDVDDPARSDVYLPKSRRVWNRAFLWGPDGALIGKTDKVFLTPLEANLLELSTGTLEDVRVFDTAVGRIGFAISRDAFIDAYRQRLDELGATLVIQPDANPQQWASDFGWEPLTWLHSVFGSISAAYPNLWINVCPMMVGNFFTGARAANGTIPGIAFDGQSTITRKSSTPPQDPVFVGNARAADIVITVEGRSQPLQGQFLAQTPWTYPDPSTLANSAELDALLDACNATPRSAGLRGRSPSSLSLDERRNVLRDCADSMLPPGPNPNAYRESAAVADVEVPVSR